MELKMLPFAGCLLIFFLHCASSEVPSFFEVSASTNLNTGSHSSHHRVNSLSWKPNECNNSINSAYMLYPIRKTWIDAKFSCYEEGGYLAYPTCVAEEKIYLAYLRLLNRGGLWLGMSDRYQEDDWVTIHGQRVSNLSHVNWAPAEPNYYGHEHCAQLYIKGKWFSANCELKLSYICKKDFHSNNAPSVQQTGH